MIYENLSYDEYCESGEAVRKYRNEHFGDGWQTDDDDMTVLFNPKTGEYCKLYVADYRDFELDDDCDDLDPFKGLLKFDYFASYKPDREYIEDSLKNFKYNVVISACLDQIVRLNKKWLYYSDAGCYVLTANPADVVNL